MPRLDVIEAVMYLPTAFLTDLSIVALVLSLITQSKKNIKLPWPKFAVSVPERFLPKIKFGLTFTLFFIAVVATIELIRNLILIGRKRLAK